MLSNEGTPRKRQRLVSLPTIMDPSIRRQTSHLLSRREQSPSSVTAGRMHRLSLAALTSRAPSPPPPPLLSPVMRTSRSDPNSRLRTPAGAPPVGVEVHSSDDWRPSSVRFVLPSTAPSCPSSPTRGSCDHLDFSTIVSVTPPPGTSNPDAAVATATGTTAVATASSISSVAIRRDWLSSDLVRRVLFLMVIEEEQRQENEHLSHSRDGSGLALLEQFVTEDQAREGCIKELRCTVERMRHDINSALSPQHNLRSGESSSSAALGGSISGTATPRRGGLLYQTILPSLRHGSSPNFHDQQQENPAPTASTAVDQSDTNQHQQQQQQHKTSSKITARDKNLLAPLSF